MARRRLHGRDQGRPPRPAGPASLLRYAPAALARPRSWVSSSTRQGRAIDRIHFRLGGSGSPPPSDRTAVGRPGSGPAGRATRPLPPVLTTVVVSQGLCLVGGELNGRSSRWTGDVAH